MSNEPIKLEQEELQKITEVQQTTQNVLKEYGSIQLSQNALNDRKKKADDAYYSILQAETEIAKELEDKYGKGSVNLTEGIFIPFANNISTD